MSEPNNFLARVGAHYANQALGRFDDTERGEGGVALSLSEFVRLTKEFDELSATSKKEYLAQLEPKAKGRPDLAAFLETLHATREPITIAVMTPAGPEMKDVVPVDYRGYAGALLAPQFVSLAKLFVQQVREMGDDTTPDQVASLYLDLSPTERVGLDQALCDTIRPLVLDPKLPEATRSSLLGVIHALNVGDGILAHLEQLMPLMPQLPELLEKQLPPPGHKT